MVDLNESLETLQIYCEQVSENKLFIGFVMVIVNVGARFIIEELSDEHRAIAKGDIFRKVVIFCSVFMATRDIIVALTVTIVFVIMINEVFGSVEEKNSGDKQKGSSAKQELDKQIDQLKLIKDSL
jgi:hypothetical protein